MTDLDSGYHGNPRRLAANFTVVFCSKIPDSRTNRP